MRPSIAIPAVLLAAAGLPQGVHSGFPPPDVRRHAHDEMNLCPAPSLFGTAFLEQYRRLVTIHWRFVPFGPEPGSGAEALQSHAVRYWPTKLVVLDGHRLCVAGKEPPPSDSTVIEVWTFGDAVTEQGTGPTGSSVSMEEPERIAVDEVYEAAAPGRDMVVALFAHWGAPRDAVLVQFWDSKAVYSIPTDGGAPALVASPVPDRFGVLVEPELASSDYDGCFQGRHVSRGFVYFFRATEPNPRKSTLVLYDQDEDGTLDGSEVISYSAWATSVYSDADAYLDSVPGVDGGR